MSQQLNSTKYTLKFAAIVCIVCSLLVTGSAVLLKDRQDANATLDKQKKVVSVSGLMDDPDTASPEEISALFGSRIHARVIDLETGEYAEDIDVDAFDQQKAKSDPDLSKQAPKNPAQIPRVPLYAKVYEVTGEEGGIERVILPVEGKGLWSTLYGFLALERDADTVAGLIFYQHGETPGLGGEVDNPNWQAKWPGREAYDDNGNLVLRVIKGEAPAPDEAPHRVDGLAGATITSNGVTNLVQFWLGENGFKAYLDRVREQGSTT